MPRRRPRMPRLWPPTYLRYVLVWPAVKAYRRKTRSRLSWRLAGSHFATVLVSVLVICLVVIVVAGVATRLTLPPDAEAALEANETAGITEKLVAHGVTANDELGAIYAGIAAGALTRNDQSDVSMQMNAGVEFKYVRAISLVAPDGTVLASSDPTLRGRSLASVDPGAWGLVQRALRSDNLGNIERLTVRRDSGPAGAFPVRDASGTVTGAILVDKTESALPSGWGMLRLLGVFGLQMGTILLVLVGLPAIPVGIVIGIRRGRAIGKPIAELAHAAEAFARGDLSARVPEIRGQDEVAGLQREFNEMADLVQTTMSTEAEHRALAEQALAANRDLIANVSHELRTPVALIRGHLEATEGDPASASAYLKIALRETDRLERLVEELFQLSRLDAHRMELDIAPFDAGSVVRATVESLAEPARREAGLTVIAEVGGGDLTALGDRLRVEQVLLNLVRNAIHFTPEGGIVLVSAEAGPGSTVRIVVRDTGIGIAPEDLPRVFDRFFRADRSRGRAGGGAGLGLAIAREYVLAMGGTIAVDSAPDEGTVFTIQLPRGAAAVPRNGHGITVGVAKR